MDTDEDRTNRTWRAALGVIADHEPYAYWRMANGAEFGWIVGRSELLADRFAAQPFAYSEIVSVTVYSEARAAGGTIACDWASLTDALSAVPGLDVVPVSGVSPWPDTPPTDAMVCQASAVPPTPGRFST